MSVLVKNPPIWIEQFPEFVNITYMLSFYSIIRTYLAILVIPFMALCGNAQVHTITFYIVDQDSHLPISDAYVFIELGQNATISDINGFTQISYDPDIIQKLIITHIAYKSKVITPGVYRQWSTREDTVYLEKNNFDLEDVVVVEKKSKKWKKRFKRFKSDFLGIDPIGKQCKILNPEVLRFTKTDSSLQAWPNDLIKIDNPYLGYQLNFLLLEFEIKDSGWISYHGHTNFIDQHRNDIVFQERRNTVFKHGQRFFLKSLINNQLQQNKYQVNKAKYEKDEFINVARMSAQELINLDTLTGYYQCSFDGFINIELSSLRKEEITGAKAVSTLESQRFNTDGSGSSSKYIPEQAQLSKVSPSIVLNAQGHILNPQDVREYGYWGLQRVAHLLPIDFELSEPYHSQDKQRKIAPHFTKLMNQLLFGANDDKYSALTFMEYHWDPAYLAPLMDLFRILHDHDIGNYILQLLNRISDNRVENYSDGLTYIWEQDSTYNMSYPNFKSIIYNHIDSKFSNYFKNRYDQSLIRWDEILWGGVKQDGIPPLHYPNFIDASEATYLKTDHTIFGINYNGQAKAYPKRILGWHEMVIDSISDLEITGVYCTLCGTMIAYNSIHNGVHHHLGTSGFLYRSNKLMYDQTTQSLWNTVEGKPVVGPLINNNIQLKVIPIVTTTWQEWLKEHPNTQVLSLETGYDRNYGEGEAYRSYYASDALMFPVIDIDHRLNNKDEVFVLRIEETTDDPVAYAVDKLIKTKLYQDTINERNVVLLASNNGNIRAYDRGNIIFNSFENGKLKDNLNKEWQVTDDQLIHSDGRQLLRIPAHRIFWFAWYAMHPKTRLVK